MPDDFDRLLADMKRLGQPVGAEVWIYHCESADLEAVTGIRWNHCAGRHDGKLGVLDWERPSKTIIGKARVCNTWNSVADPRVDWPATTHGGRPDCYGMTDERRPSGTVRGEQTIYSSKASTPDPRVETAIPERKQRKNGGRGVEASDEAAHAILGEGSVSNTRASLADARVDTRVRPDGNPPRRDGYGMEDAEGPASTVRGRHDIWAAPASTTDPRLVRPQRSDAYGVNSAAEPSGTIVGHHQHDNVAGSVADARVAVELDHTPRRGSMGGQLLETSEKGKASLLETFPGARMVGLLFIRPGTEPTTPLSSAEKDQLDKLAGEVRQQLDAGHMPNGNDLDRLARWAQQAARHGVADPKARIMCSDCGELHYVLLSECNGSGSEADNQEMKAIRDRWGFS